MKITVLIENTCASATDGLVCEHGLSLLIEQEQGRYLLDAGSTGIFLQNADKMGVSLDGLDFCVLSHGHYDHAGGFAALLERVPTAKIYALRQAGKSYCSNAGGTMHEIGIPHTVLPRWEESFCWLDGPAELAPGIYFLPHTTPGLQSIGARKGLFRQEGAAFVPDDFSHEGSLVFDTAKGLVVFNSCSHGGVIAILEEAKRALPGRPVFAFFGGLHMKSARDGVEVCTFSQSELDEIGNYIKRERLAVYTGHCTGRPGYRELKRRLGDRLHPLSTGEVITLDVSCRGQGVG